MSYALHKVYEIVESSWSSGNLLKKKRLEIRNARPGIGPLEPRVLVKETL